MNGIALRCAVAAVAAWAITRVPEAQGAPSGRELFTKNCAQCHGKDGHGFTPMGKQLRIKDLTASKLGDAQIRTQIMDGTKDAKGTVRMAAFKDKISVGDVEQLVAFVKSLRH